MRAVVLLWLLHGAIQGDSLNYSWHGLSPLTEPTEFADPDLSACVYDQTFCGCCLMTTQLERMKTYFEDAQRKMTEQMKQAMKILGAMRTNRAAFSAALNDNASLECFGPFNKDEIIVYTHVFLNMGQRYSQQSGVFVAPHSGVYSFSVTIYSRGSSEGQLNACANLQINGKMASGLHEQNSEDLEDSNTIVVAMKLKAGDQVAVSLPQGCKLCDHNSHYNTFTGSLLYTV